MPDQGVPLDRRHLQQPILDALAAMQEHVTELQASVQEITAQVALLLAWQKEQAEEDRVRRDLEQKEHWRAEWKEEQAAARRRKVESWRKIGRAVGALIAAADAIGLWEVVGTSDHGLRWTLQTGVALCAGLVAIVLLIL